MKVIQNVSDVKQPEAVASRFRAEFVYFARIGSDIPEIDELLYIKVEATRCTRVA